MWVQGHQNVSTGTQPQKQLHTHPVILVTCLCALWRYKAEIDHPAADELVWCSMQMIADNYIQCVSLRELATAISVQVTSMRRGDWSNMVQNVYRMVSLHGAIVNTTENRVIVNVYLQELCYILLVMNFWGITVKCMVYVGLMYLYGGPTLVTETVRLIVLLLYSYTICCFRFQILLIKIIKLLESESI